MRNSECFMRTKELESLKAIARSIGQNYDALPDAPITAFMAMVGNQYQGELMVVGRAVNRWTTGWLPQELKNEVNITECMKGVLQSVTDGQACPMQWVSECWGNYDHDYNTKKSAFWRVIRQVIDDLRIADIESLEWPSHIIWSNLYKFAPVDGGNPSSFLSSIQFDECKTLIGKEINMYSPKRILFLTGMNWAEPFIEGLAMNVTTFANHQYVEGIGKLNLSCQTYARVVVAAHPQGKNEKIWVEEVVSAFGIG